MTRDSVDLSSQSAFSGAWSTASYEEDLRRWTAFLAQHGVEWSAGPKDREFVDQMIRSGSPRSGEGIERRLSKLANDVLTGAADARRLCMEVGGAAVARRWHVLSSDQRRTFEQAGRRFDSGLQGPLRQLATIPITLGVYFGAQYACRAAGLDAAFALIVAIVAYVLTARVLRGRWPLQRA